MIYVCTCPEVIEQHVVDDNPKIRASVAQMLLGRIRRIADRECQPYKIDAFFSGWNAHRTDQTHHVIGLVACDAEEAKAEKLSTAIDVEIAELLKLELSSGSRTQPEDTCTP